MPTLKFIAFSKNKVATRADSRINEKEMFDINPVKKDFFTNLSAGFETKISNKSRQKKNIATLLDSDAEE